MMGKTHRLGGLVSAVTVSCITGYLLPDKINLAVPTINGLKEGITQWGVFVAYIGCSEVGSLVLDIDKKGSTISNRHKIISFFVRLFCSHRGFTHSLLALSLFTGILYFPVLYYCPVLLPAVYGLSIGYTSHIFLDMLNPDGCPLLYPIRKKVSLCKIETGSFVERLFNVFQIGILVFEIYLMIKQR